MKSLKRKNAEKLLLMLLLIGVFSSIVCGLTYYYLGENGDIVFALPVFLLLIMMFYIQNNETLISSLPSEMMRKLKFYEQNYGNLVDIKVIYDNTSYTGTCEYDVEAHYYKKKDLIFANGKVISFEETDFKVTRIIGEEKAGIV